ADHAGLEIGQVRRAAVTAGQRKRGARVEHGQVGHAGPFAEEDVVVRHAVPRGVLACTVSWYGVRAHSAAELWEFCCGFSRVRPAVGRRPPAGRQVRLPGTAGVSWWLRRVILEPSQTSGSYLRPTTRSFIGISALSVILMFSGQTSVQHLVMLQ